ncbi:MAG: hypothetical protein JW928_08335 [Candidatus Aureabacteria bacterium]|nr:hypothetical protein [Candidatus Auribacterota bacterium]
MNKTFLKNLIFTLLIFGVFLVALEILCRVFYPDAMSFRMIKFHNDPSSFRLFQKDYDLGWKLRPGRDVVFCGVKVRTNSLGMRCPEPLDDASLRLLFIGDSTTFGWGIDQEKTYPSLVLKDLQNKFPEKSIDMLNTAVPGYTSLHGRIFVDKNLSRFHPDWVIVCLSNNEYEHAPRTLLEDYRKRTFLSLFKRPFYHLYFYQLISDLFLYRSPGHLKPSMKKDDLKPKVPLADFSENILYIIDSCSRSSRIIVLSMPRNIIFPPNTSGEIFIDSKSLDLTYEGLKLHKKKNYSEAMRFFEEAIKIDEDNYQAFFWAGRASLMLGNASQGVHLIETSIQKDPFSQIVPKDYESVLEDICLKADKNVVFINIHRLFENDFPDEVFLDRAHPSEKGLEIIAENLSRAIGEEVTKAVP